MSAHKKTIMMMIKTAPQHFNICHSGGELKTFGYITEMTEHMHTEMKKLQEPQGQLVPAMLDSTTNSGKTLLRKFLA